MPFNIGPGELLLILAIALLVIGPGRLPDVGAALGKSLREFRKASTEMQDAVTSATAVAKPAPVATNPSIATPAPPSAQPSPAAMAAAAPAPVAPADAPVAAAAPAVAPTDAPPPTDRSPLTADVASTGTTVTSGSPEADAESTPGA